MLIFKSYQKKWQITQDIYSRQALLYRERNVILDCKLGAGSITRIEVLPSEPLGKLTLPLLPLLELLVPPRLLGSMLSLPTLILVPNLREGQVEEM